MSGIWLTGTILKTASSELPDRFVTAMTAFPIVANATHSVIANTVGVKQPSSDGEGDLDCRVGLQPSRNDGVFLGIANTTTVIANTVGVKQSR
ncbi:MAG: hypothetical protein HS120_09815 [Burkholderiales bacterium]|nr:hypothetical protein [Burkholderiales bacterium]